MQGILNLNLFKGGIFEKRNYKFWLALSLFLIFALLFIKPSFAQAVSIYGTVTNGTDPISDVYVSVYDSVTHECVTSTYNDPSTGGYAFDLSDGDYKVEFDPSLFNGFSGENLLGEWYDSAADFDSATSITVTAPNDTLLSDAVLEEGGTISGTVTSDGTNPIENVGVWFYNINGEQYGTGYAVTDASGIYTVDTLPSGTYKVSFDAPYGSNYLDEWYSDAPDSTTATPITVTAPNAVIDINATLEEGGSISGTVTNDGGAGIPDVYVYIYSDTCDYLGSASTDASGIYTVHALPSGTRKVTIDEPYDSN